MNGISGFFHGTLALPRAVSTLLHSPRLLAWSAAIWIAALAITVGGGLVLHAGINGLITGILGWALGQPLPDPGTGILSGVLSVLVAIAAFWFFNQLTFLAAIPLSDFLAEAAEADTVPALTPAPKNPGLRDRLRFIGLDAIKSLIGGMATVLALILGWLPGVNLLAPLLLALALTFQMISFPQTRRGLGFKAGLRFIGRNFAGSLGFGGAVLLAFSIPIVGALALPVAVIAGTRLYAAGRQD